MSTAHRSTKPRRSTLGSLALIGAMLPWATAVHAQAVDAPADTGARTVAPMPSLAPMIRRISQAVVSIGIQGTVREQGSRNPLFDDPF
ncbi:MAG: hypothetical protein ACKODA_11320 [Nevskiaceae bacterium]